MKTINTIKTITLSGFIFSLISCASPGSHHHHTKEIQEHAHSHHQTGTKSSSISKETPLSKLSNDGLYKVSLYSNTIPVPLRKIHQWTIHIERKDGTPVEDASVFVFGGMPMHNHDFPTVPKVKQYLGNGNYLIEGIKFSMIGHWEMRFNIKERHQKDRVIFEINM